MTNPADRLKTASKQQILQWVEEAQNDLSARGYQVIPSDWNLFALDVDGSENDLFRSDSRLKLPTEEETESDGDSEDGDEDPFKDLDADSELKD